MRVPYRVERDIVEKVLSGAWDPRFRDEATVPKRDFLVVQVVDDVIQDFCWEVEIRHRGSRHDAIASVLALR